MRPCDRASLRSLLRLCRRADCRPQERILLLGQPPEWFLPQLASIARSKVDWPFVSEAVRNASGGCTEFAHPTAAVTVSAAVRSHWRLAELMGLDYAAEANELQAHLMKARVAADGIEAICRRYKSESPAVALRETLEPNLALQRLPPGTSSVTCGDLLLAHPISCISSIFDRSVILIDEHDHLVAQSVRGLVLNKPGNTTLRKLLNDSQAGFDDRAWLEELGPLLDVPLHQGGPVLGPSVREAVTWHHRSEGSVPDSYEILPSLWAGGDPSAVGAFAVENPGKVTVYAGYAGWATDQLTNELERGVWVHARGCSAAAALQPVCHSAEEALDMWQVAMHRAQMPALAEFPRGRHVDIKLAELVDEHFRWCMDKLQPIGESV